MPFFPHPVMLCVPLLIANFFGGATLYQLHTEQTVDLFATKQMRVCVLVLVTVTVATQ